MTDLNLWKSQWWQEERLDEFRKMMRRHPDFTFYPPNHKSAPWHVQATSQEGTVINFWPHLMKGQIEGHKSVQGPDECDALFDMVRTSDDEPDFSVFEVFDDE